MPREKVQHEIVELARPLPGHGMAGIGNHRPFVMLHVRAPIAASKPVARKIGVRGNNERRVSESLQSWRRYSVCVAAAETGAGLARIARRSRSTFGAFRIGAAIDAPISR